MLQPLLIHYRYRYLVSLKRILCLMALFDGTSDAFVGKLASTCRRVFSVAVPSIDYRKKSTKADLPFQKFKSASKKLLFPKIRLHHDESSALVYSLAPGCYSLSIHEQLENANLRPACRRSASQIWRSQYVYGCYGLPSHTRLELVVITGASSGLGRKACLALLRSGDYHVVGAVREYVIVRPMNTLFLTLYITVWTRCKLWPKLMALTRIISPPCIANSTRSRPSAPFAIVWTSFVNPNHWIVSFATLESISHPCPTPSGVWTITNKRCKSITFPTF